ncbi:MAG: ATP-binding protein [Acidobacteria bacterium]|nr:ATP-binding protein [Acidobacteriota bacterium]
MKQHSLKRATGNWVTGDQFWDREEELALFLERLEEGANLLLTAPRRIGKTSLLKEAMLRLEGRYVCLFADLQKAESAADAIAEICLATASFEDTWGKVKRLFSNVLPDNMDVKYKDISVHLRSGLNAANWRGRGDEVLDSLAGADKPVAIFLDEVAILVNRLLRGPDYQVTAERKKDVDALLSWLRAACLRHQGRIRFVVTGSIGLEPLVRQAGLSATLNAFTPFTIGPWRREIAAGCLHALANGYEVTIGTEAMDQMLDQLGVFIPHHVQMFFDHVYQEARLAKTQEVTVAMVNEVYQHSMLGIRGHVELSHMEERLKMALGPKLDVLALDLLTEAAVHGDLTEGSARALAMEQFGTDWAGPLRDVLGILEHDGYLRPADERYVFESKLLREWWRARFRFAYVPVAQRQK